ncbi:TPA: hypothetical protein R4S64_000736 [Kluyvera georgiana]|uniref:hypothetical protein n=1 Tax=Kluyvera georgiana TaxID=73098 RepID=UPI0013DCC1F7|nr:hypothetical protein [Kluyvera georgiana]HED1418775.1 hypothetical protein [Kluyvera georgiana]
MHIKLSILAIAISAISMSIQAEPLQAQAFRDNAAAKAFASIAASDLNNATQKLNDAKATGTQADIDSAAQSVRAKTQTMNLAQQRISATSVALQNAIALDAKAAANAPKVPPAPPAPPAPPVPIKKPVHYFAEFKGGNNDHSNNSRSHGGSGNGGDNAQATRSAGAFSTGGSHIGGGRTSGGFHY